MSTRTRTTPWLFSIVAALAALAFPSAPAVAAPVTLTIDPVHSEVTFRVKHMMVSNVRGRFDDFGGTIVFDEANPQNSSVRFAAKTASVNTNNERRDNHLRTEDFFAVDKNPELTFQSTQVIKKSDTVFAVTGDLTMRGVTQPVTLEMTYNGKVNDPRGTPKYGFETETTLSRRDFGIAWNVDLDSGGLLVGENVQVVLAIQAGPAPAPVAAAGAQ